ncbi:MAG TPA: LysR substrate-binding domain-containing protein [Stellaceae bacterium]|nr:LysR substrate-binding domain-containing protein [Stellaceae bacterium]
MIPTLDPDLLKTFVAVTEESSFSRAARRVGRSQSAVSMQMQRLEQVLGKALLRREPRSVRLTQAGEGFLVYARRIVKLSEEAWASIAEPQEAGSVRLGVPDDYAVMLLPPVLSRFAAEHPSIAVELICEQSTSLIGKLEAGNIDLALVTRRPSQALEVLRRERLVWVASPLHAPWENDPLPIALYEPGCTARDNVLASLSDTGRAYRCLYSSPSLVGLTAVVRAGLAVAALAECGLPPGLRIIGRKEGLPPLRDLEIGLMRSPLTASSSAVNRLDEFLRQGVIGSA